MRYFDFLPILESNNLRKGIYIQRFLSTNIYSLFDGKLFLSNNEIELLINLTKTICHNFI